MTRRPAVAGQFYESSPEALQRQVLSFVKHVDKRVEAKAILSPHAGYVCSGPVAGKVYSQLVNYETYVILGPNHTGVGSAIALAPDEDWATPLGSVPIDIELRDSILQRFKLARQDGSAHRFEHSIEVQLPFIQVLNDSFSIVPICLGFRDYATAEGLGEAIAASVLASGKRVLLVASSDMSHYIPHDMAVKRDRMAIDKILELDASGLHRVVQMHSISMCGVVPTVVALVAAKRLSASGASLVSYMTSGQTCSTKMQVVGYAGIVIR